MGGGAIRRGLAVIAVALLAACTPAVGTDPPPSSGSAAATGEAATGEAATGRARAGRVTPSPAATGAADEPVIAPSGPFAVGTVTLRDGDRSRRVDVWIADQPDLHSRGLMAQTTLPDGAGMLFVYDAPARRSFWMLNTPLPLSIAFFADDGAGVAILDMPPCPEQPCPTYGPDRPFRYALEVPQGWFDEAGVDAGWRLDATTVPAGAAPPGS